MVSYVRRRAAVREEQAFIAAIIRVPHGGVHAHVGRDPREHDISNPALAEHHVEVRCVKRALAGLVDDGLAVDRPKLGDDLPPGLRVLGSLPVLKVKRVPKQLRGVATRRAIGGVASTALTALGEPGR